ncbi:hypothetical protein FKP32DRAFT_1154626 [Trametes sanguinea]|nr:hypothetical protein FKP32DRAFT_1154626 [Trametes sanguinea]
MTVPVNETTPPKADATDGSIPVPSGQADPGTSTLQAPGGTVRPQGAATGALSSNVTAPQSQVAVDPKAPAEGSAPAATTPAPAKPTEVIKGYHIHRIPGDQLQGKSRLVDYYNPCDSSYQRRKSYLFAHEKLAHGTVKYGLTEPYRVVLLSHDRSKTWTVSESFAWGGQPTKAWPHPLKVHDFKMGVAFAGAKSDVLNKRFDGILGLGTLRYQNAFVHRSKSSYRTVGDYDDILSFIAALSPSLPQQTGDIANKGIEIVVYLILRPSPRTLSVEVPSCMAWQAWPFGFTPQWSAPLFVRDPSSGKWRLWLKGIRIWHGPEWNQSPLHKTQTTPPTAYVPIPAGWAFELDTGTSLSYFPQQIWDPLVRSLPVDTKHASSIDAGPGSYRLRDKGKGTKHRWLQGYIEFVFESKTKSKTESVSVWTRVQPFLFDRDGNGGVFSVPLGDETSGNALPGILGLNFLQGTYTALHYPRHGRGPPYVRMAMQDRPAVDDPSHQLPPEA